MNILLDTHFLLWAVLNPDILSDDVRTLLLDTNNTIYYSILSLWEIEIKHLKRPEDMAVTARDIDELSKEAGFIYFPLQRMHIMSLSTLVRDANAKPHKDPFDRLLIAQAKSSNMLLLTHDELLPAYNESCVKFM